MSKPYIELTDGTKHVFGEPFTPNIHVIAEALSHINRYTGHAGGYSVAQHSVLCAREAPEEHKLAALLHDAHEAYLGDMSAPLKRLISGYCELEQKYHDMIDAHFKIKTRHHAVCEVDLRMLATEARSFGMGFWRDLALEPYSFSVSVTSAHQSKELFLATYYGLTS